MPRSMTTQQALHNLHLLDGLLSRPSPLPMSQRMSQLFQKVIVSNDGTQLYGSNSIRGKCVRLIRGFETGNSKEHRVSVVVLQALELTRGVSNLWQPCWEALESYAKQIIAASERKKRAEPSRISLRPDSPLLHLRDEREAPSDSVMHQLFGLHPEGTECLEYIRDQPGLHAAWTRLYVAEQRAAHWEEEIARHPEDGEQRKNIRFLQARELAEQVAALTPHASSLKRVLFLGRYGIPIRSLSDLFCLYEQLRHPIRQVVSQLEGFSNLFVCNDGMGCIEQAISRWESADETVERRVSAWREWLHTVPFSRMHMFFEDQDRDLPEWLKKLLPDAATRLGSEVLQRGILANYVQMASLSGLSTLQETWSFLVLFGKDQGWIPDVIGLLLSNLLGTVPSEAVRRLVDWLQDHGSDFTHPLRHRQRAAIQRLETFIRDSAHLHWETILQHLVDRSNTLLQALGSVPSVRCGLQALGWNALGRSGPFWIQILSEEDPSLRRMEIYSDVPGSWGHLASTQAEVWPRVIRGVPKEALSTQFFEFLLFHRYEGGRGGTIGLSLEELYQTVEQMVGGSIEPTGERDAFPTGASIRDRWVWGKNSQLQKVELRWEALVRYCQSRVQENDLSFGTNEESKQLVRHAVQSLKKDLAEIASQLDPARLEVMQQTLEEILAVVGTSPFQAPNSPIDTTWVVEPIVRQLRKLGISSESILDYGDMLEALLGPDAMRLLEQVLESIDDLELSTSATEGSNEVEESRIRFAFRVIRNLYSVYRIVTVPVRLLGLLCSQPMISREMSNWVLFPILWPLYVCSSVLGILRQMIVSMVVFGVLKWVLGAEVFDTLQELQKTIEASAQTILGTKTVSYAVSQEDVVELDSLHFQQELYTRIELPPGLASLGMFAASEQIHCLYRPDSSHVDWVLFPSYNQMTFEIISVDGELQAMSHDHPGYYIDPIQYQSIVDRLPCRLLLRNRSGKQKVCLPANQWGGNGLTYLQDLLGSFGSATRPLFPLLASWSLQHTSPQQVFVYEVTSSGRLTTTDLPALVYLLLTYVVQSLLHSEEALKRAEQVSHDLAQEIRKQPINESALHSLMWLGALPDSYEKLQQIRILLFSTIEECRQKQQQETVSSFSSGRFRRESIVEPSLPLSVFSWVAARQDLLSLQRTPARAAHIVTESDHQEWLLYQYWIRETSQLIRKGKITTKWAQVRIPRFISDAVADVVVSGLNPDRYQQLKVQHGVVDNGWVRLCQWLTAPRSSFDLPGKMDRLFTLPLPFIHRITERVERMVGLPAPKPLPSTAEMIEGSLQEWYHTLSLSVEDFDALRRAAKPIDLGVSLELDALTALSIQEQFFSYYAILRGKAGPEAQELLSQRLIYLKGRFGRREEGWIKMLHTIHQHPLLFPSAQELYHVCTAPPTLPLVAQSDRIPVEWTAEDQRLLHRLNGWFQREEREKVAVGMEALQEKISTGKISSGRVLGWLSNLYSATFHHPATVAAFLDAIQHVLEEDPALQAYAQFLRQVMQHPHCYNPSPERFAAALRKAQYAPSIEQCHASWFATMQSMQESCNWMNRKQHPLGKAIDLVRSAVGKSFTNFTLLNAVWPYPSTFTRWGLWGLATAIDKGLSVAGFIPKKQNHTQELGHPI